MISFMPLSDEGDVRSYLCGLLGGSCDGLDDIISQFTPDDDTEPAFSAYGGCILPRIYDGEYLFAYPIALTDSADILGAVRAVADYTVREEIPLVFFDVPCEDVGALVSAFRHCDIDAEDIERSTYTVRVKSECAMLDEPPSSEYDGITLDAIGDADLGYYGYLCSDPDTNRFWGYDYREDSADASDKYFLGEAMREFAAGAAIHYAIREDGCFVGEAIIYGFDLVGCAEVAIRLLPKERGRGIGRRAVFALVDVARGIGLVSLRASVMKENTASVKLFSSLMEKTGEDSGKINFALCL